MINYIITAIICYFIGYIIGLYVKGNQIKSLQYTIDGYFHIVHVGVPPVLAEDSAGKKIYRCKKCYKRVYQTLRHCPSCGQRIDWSIVNSQETKKG